MRHEILFVGGSREPFFDDVETPLPERLSVEHDGRRVTYTLFTLNETLRRRDQRHWPVYVHGPLPAASTVLALWRVRAKIWQPLTPRPAAGAFR